MHDDPLSLIIDASFMQMKIRIMSRVRFVSLCIHACIYLFFHSGASGPFCIIGVICSKCLADCFVDNLIITKSQNLQFGWIGFRSVGKVQKLSVTLTHF